MQQIIQVIHLAMKSNVKTGVEQDHRLVVDIRPMKDRGRVGSSISGGYPTNERPGSSRIID